MSARLPIQIDYRVPASQRAPSVRLMTRWVDAALGLRGHGCEIALQTVTAPAMRKLNHQYRGKDKPTNVLSFPATAVPGVTPRPLGDVVLCPAVLRSEAREQGKAEHAHWAHLVVHGSLHLLGYDHENDDDAQRMERREITILRKLGFANPYSVGRV
jgi:probable rRNA maturation factor